MSDRELNDLKQTVAQLQAAIAKVNENDRTSVSRARRIRRRATWIGAVGFCILPVVAWAAVELSLFQKGEPISSGDVNANFSSINAALDGPVVLADQPVDTWVSNDPALLPVDNAELAISSTGGRVHLQLIPITATDGFSGLASRIAVEGPPDQSISATISLERSGDGGVTWELRSYFAVTDSNAQGTVHLAPSIVSFLDDPPGGDWRYRLSASPEAAATAVSIINARWVARELANGS